MLGIQINFVNSLTLVASLLNLISTQYPRFVYVLGGAKVAPGQLSWKIELG